MLKRYFLIFILIFFSAQSFSQGKFSTSNLVFGGNFGAGFSSQETIVAISPTVGYRFSERFVAGPGAIYQYYEFKPFHVSNHNYGGKLFADYLLTENIIAHTEYELLNLGFVYVDPSNNTAQTIRKTIGSLFVGGGYRSMIGSNSSADIMVLFNLTETPYTPYSNPIIRFGLSFGVR